jgi:hypothetical protein
MMGIFRDTLFTSNFLLFTLTTFVVKLFCTDKIHHKDTLRTNRQHFYLPAVLGIIQVENFNKETDCFKTYLK